MKKIFTLIFTFLFAAGIAGCGKNDTISIDIDALSKELMEKVKFDDELVLSDSETAARVYGIESAVKSKLYIGSGATAEEIAVFEFGSVSDAEEGLKAAEARISEQKKSYESYAPDEIKRLDNSVVKCAGKYVAVCVTNDKAAEKIISEYLN